ERRRGEPAYLLDAGYDRGRRLVAGRQEAEGARRRDRRDQRGRRRSTGHRRCDERHLERGKHTANLRPDHAEAAQSAPNWTGMTDTGAGPGREQHRKHVGDHQVTPATPAVRRTSRRTGPTAYGVVAALCLALAAGVLTGAPAGAAPTAPAAPT